MLLQYLQPEPLLLMTDSIRRHMLEIRFLQYSRDISKTQTIVIASINSGIEIGCLAATLSSLYGSGQAPYPVKEGPENWHSRVTTSLSVQWDMEHCQA